MAKAGAIEEYVKKSSLNVKLVGEKKALMQCDFVYKSVRFEITGEIDLATGTVGPVRQRLTVEQALFFEATCTGGKGRTRREYKFGNATQGARTLILNTEKILNGEILTGHADGRELVPYYLSRNGCGCGGRKNKKQRPLLAWGEDSATRPVSLKMSAKPTNDFEGLGHVMERLAEQQGGGIWGDLGDCINWIICYVTCEAGLIWCIFQSIFSKFGDIIYELCFVTNGDCFDWCTFVGTPIG